MISTNSFYKFFHNLGKLSVDSALQKAYGLGVASQPYEELEQFVDNTQPNQPSEIYNFGIYWYGRQNKSVKCILHIDCVMQEITLLHHGKELRSYSFPSLINIDNTDDSTRIFIYFNDASELEVDPGSYEDKNRISRVLISIVDQAVTGASYVATDMVASHRETVIKEGILEKRGRSAAFLVWSRRYVKIFPKEIMYFRVGEEHDENSALSILPLNRNSTIVKKVDDNGFLFTCSKKDYVFRLQSTFSRPSDRERERDDWIIAIQSALKPDRGLYEDSFIDQETYLTSIVKSLNQELEQLGSILNIIDAPIRATTQVKKVRDIVHSLKEQVETGMLSWTLRGGIQENEVLKSPRDAVPPHGEYVFDQEFQQQSCTNHKLTNNEHHQQENANNTFNMPSVSQVNNLDETPNPSTQYKLYEEAWKENGIVRGYTKIKKESGRIPVSHPSYVNLEMNYFGPGTEDNPPELPPKIHEHSHSNYMPQSEIYGNKETDNSVSSDLNRSSGPKNLSRDKIYTDTSIALKQKPTEVPSKKKDEETVPNDCNTETKNLAKKFEEKDAQNPSIVKDATVPAQNNDSATNVPKASLAPSVLPPGVPKPPPFMLSNLPKKSFVQPSCKMKPLFWSKISEFQVGSSFWKNAEDRISTFDLKKLESLFFAEQQNVNGERNEKEKSEVSTQKLQKKSLLNPKKAQNLGIFLNGFKLSGNDIEAKLNIVKYGLSCDEIIALKRFQPTTEEVELFKSLTEDKIDIEVDLFMHKLCLIDNLSERLDILLNLQEIPELYESLKEPLQNISLALKTLLSNQSFVRLLEYLLSVGNYLNSGSNRGNAYGFRLSALPKLTEVRSVNKETSLFDYIVEELYKKDKDILICYQDFLDCSISTDVTIKGLIAETEIMQKDLSNVEKIVNSLKTKVSKEFLEDVEKFINDHKIKVSDIMEKCKEIKETSNALLTVYGETSSTDFDSWLKTVYNFMKTLQSTVQGIQEKERRKIKTSNKHENRTVKEINFLGDGESEEFQRKLAPKKTSTNKAPAQTENHHVRRDDNINLQSNMEGESCLRQSVGKAKVFSRQQSAVLDYTGNENKSGTEDASWPTRFGFLSKLSGGKKRQPKWDRRYFELTTSGYLHYSKKEDGKLSGTIYLRGVPIRVDSSNPLVLIIVREDREWKLKGNNELEVQDWLNDLQFYSQRDAKF